MAPFATPSAASRLRKKCWRRRCDLPAIRAPAVAYLDDYQLQPGSDSPEIAGVAGDDGLPCPLRTNDDVGIDDIGRRGSCQQKAGSRGIRSVERNKIRAGLSNQPGEAGLPGRIT